MKPAALLVAALALVTGCDKKKADYSGIGNWKFTSSTLKQALDMRTELGPICQPTELTDGRKATWCFALPPYKVGKRVADVDLYFLGNTPDAKLIEIQLKVRGCVEDELDQWLRSGFGPPFESKATRAYWKNAHLWIAALLPSEPGRCVVHFLPLSENAEIERIKQK